MLSAQGSRLRWYADAQKQQLLAEGESFKPSDMQSRSYYVTQSSESCESEPIEVRFTAKYFDATKAFFPNMISPDGDAYNQLYYIRDFATQECLGSFSHIRISNRWGQQVFESQKQNFSWDASTLPAGVYYYQMKYQLKTFHGYIHVVR